MLYKPKTAVAVALAVMGLMLHQAQATFIENTDFKGEMKLFNDKDHKNVLDFIGTVGGHSGPAVRVDANARIDSGAGFANITPVHGANLTQLTFTPADNTLFSDFSFRGQLTQAGFVTVRVFDSEGLSFLFTTHSEGKDDDIPRFGVISNDGETIDHVVISANSFKDFKQVEFSFGNGVAAPDGGNTVMLMGGALLALMGLSRLKNVKGAILAGMLAIAALGMTPNAKATAIDGDIELGGSVHFNTLFLNTATQVNTWVSDGNVVGFTSIQPGGTGDFRSTIIPLGTLVQMATPWVFGTVNGGPQPALWSVFGFTFDLASSHVDFRSNRGLVISGVGTVSHAGFDDTAMEWQFTTQNAGGGGGVFFSFSANAVGANVPDGGSTVMLLGGAMSLLGIVRRFII